VRTAARQDGSGRETGDHRSNEEDPDEVPTDRSKGKREKDQHQHAERCCIQDQRLPRAGREVSGGDGQRTGGHACEWNPHLRTLRSESCCVVSSSQP